MDRMTEEELEKLKDFKVYAFEGDVYVKAEDYKEIAIENKKLKKYYDRDKEELMESCYGLARENDELKLHIEAKDKAYMDLLTDYNYLKARIKRMEKAYLKFNKDFKKLDDELDNAIMNR